MQKEGRASKTHQQCDIRFEQEAKSLGITVPGPQLASGPSSDTQFVDP